MQCMSFVSAMPGLEACAIGLVMTILGSIPEMSLQESQARLSKSEAAVAEVKEAHAASQSESAALQDTIKLQASEISALSRAKEDATVKTAELEGQLEDLQAALQAAQEQSETASMELRELQDSAQQAQVCSNEDAAHHATQYYLKQAGQCSTG